MHACRESGLFPQVRHAGPHRNAPFAVFPIHLSLFLPLLDLFTVFPRPFHCLSLTNHCLSLTFPLPFPCMFTALSLRPSPPPFPPDPLPSPRQAVIPDCAYGLTYFPGSHFPCHWDSRGKWGECQPPAHRLPLLLAPPPPALEQAVSTGMQRMTELSPAVRRVRHHHLPRAGASRPLTACTLRRRIPSAAASLAPPIASSLGLGRRPLR